jgi:hypothetical protein
MKEEREREREREREKEASLYIVMNYNNVITKTE